MTTELKSKKNCQLILALDIEEKGDALALLEKAGEELDWVKIGLQMFTKYGPEYVRDIASLGKKIFLDLKLHDIPNTVAKAIQSVAALPIQMLTIHTCGGKEMMERAVEAQQKANPELQLLGVTVLTSMDIQSLKLIGIEQPIPNRVNTLASLAKESGMNGLVCSSHEVVALKQAFHDHFTLVTPGIRPAGSADGDQKRVMTPFKAAEAGSNYIVVGRPIYGSEDPVAIIRKVKGDLSDFQ